MITPADILAAANAFKDAIKGDVVDDATIASRTEICLKCPKRQRNSGIITRVSKILGDLANRHRVPDSIAGYRCGVCKCSLMLLVPATEKDQHKDSPQEAKRRPASCWMKQQR
jgi:hypothetical protein